MGKRSDDGTHEEYCRRLTTCLAAAVVLLMTGFFAVSWPFWTRLYSTSRVMFAGFGLGLETIWDLDIS